MMLRPSIFALIATAMAFSARGVSITVNATVDSRIESVSLRSGNQNLGPVARNGSATWVAWSVGTAYTPSVTGVPTGYSAFWSVSKSGETTISGGAGDAITIPTSSYAGCTLSFYASPNKYTVTLDRQGGSGGTDSVAATYDAAMPSINVPSRTGYIFGGYFTAANGGGTQYYTATAASARTWDKTAATTLYAKWTAKTCSVTLDRQGGSGGTASVTATYNAAMPSIAVPSRTGYIFGGYYTAANGGGTQYYTATAASARTWDKTAATTLYAKWTAKTCSVTLDRQNGSGGTASVTAAYGSAMPSITVPTRTGYVFGGYFTSANGGGVQYYKADGTSARTWDKTSATTLYAKWTASTCAVTLDSSPGSGGTGSVTAAYGSAMPAITAPARSGYAFGGYFTSANGGGVQYYKADGTSSRTWDKTSATTLYAKWTANTYELGYDNLFLLCDFATNAIASASMSQLGSVVVSANAGTVVIKGLDGASNVSIYSRYARTVLASSGMHSFPVEGGATYAISCNLSKGNGTKSTRIWAFFFDEADNYISPNGAYSEGGPEISVGANSREITAPGDAAHMALFFYANCSAGESVAFSKIKVCKADPYSYVSIDSVRKMYTYNDNGLTTYGTLATPTRTGHAFTGWFTAESGGMQITADTIVCPESTSIFSRWTVNSYKVTLDRQSGSGGTASLNVAYGSAMPSATMPTRTGYSFGGYYTDPDGGGVQYYTAEGKSARQWDIGSDTTLYAKWTVNNYSVTLNPSPGGGGTLSVNATYGSPLPSITVPERTGYSFGGYYNATNGDGTQYYSSNGKSTRDWDKATAATLYAKWTAKTYKVTLDKQSDGSTTSVDAVYDSDMPVISTPTWTGHTFHGYFTGTSGSGTKYYGADGKSAHAWDKTSPTTLYAYWTVDTYTVTLDAQGGSGGIASITTTYGSAMPPATMPKRTGYTFVGYYTGTNGNGTQYYDADGASMRTWTLTSATTLYAKWMANTYELGYDNQFLICDFATNALACASMSKLGSVTVSARDGTVVIRGLEGASNVGIYSRYSRTGLASSGMYSFPVEGGAAYAISCFLTKGNGTKSTRIWAFFFDAYGDYITPAGAYSEGGPEISVGANSREITAPGDAAHMALFFYANCSAGESVKFSSVKVCKASPYSSVDNASVRKVYTYDDSGITYGTLAEAKRPGYTFGGWFTAENGGGAEVTKDTFVRPESATIYSKWTANEYTVMLDWQSGSGGTDSVTATYGTPMLQITVPKRTGYDFDGYYSSSNGGGVRYYRADGKSARVWDKTSATTLYANWTAKTYKVTLDNQSDGSTDSVDAVYDSDMPAISPPTWEGHYFGGYYTAADGGGVQYYKADGTSARQWNIASNATLHAKWTAYIVHFDANGGTGTMPDLYCSRDTATALSSNAFTRIGYRFEGWATSRNGGKVYDNGASINVGTASATTLYAKWEANTYELGYDNLFLLCDFAANAPACASMTRLGSVAVSAREGTVVVRGLEGASNAGIYSRYSRTGLASSGMHSFPVEGGAAYAISCNLSKGNGAKSARVWAFFFDVSGNYISPNGAYSEGGPEISVGANSREITAPGDAAHMALFFYANCSAGESVAFSKIKVCKADPYSSVENASVRKVYTYDDGGTAYGTLAEAKRTGYTFNGWFTAENGGGSEVTRDTFVRPESATIYSKWTANTCAVTLDMQSGSGGTASVTATYGSPMPPITRPTRAGYAFGGYYLSVGGGDVQYYGADGTGARTWDVDSGTATLRARWTTNTVRFDANGGRGTMQDQLCPSGAASLPANAFTRTGYRFAGWATSADGDAEYGDGDDVSFGAGASGGELTLYAKWEANTYELGYDNLFLLCDFATNAPACASMSKLGSVDVSAWDGTVVVRGLEGASNTGIYSRYARTGLASSGMHSFPVEGGAAYAISCNLSKGNGAKSARIWAFFFDASGNYIAPGGAYSEGGTSLSDGANVREIAAPAAAARMALFFNANCSEGESVTFSGIKVCRADPYSSVAVDSVRKAYAYDDGGAATYGELAAPERAGYTFKGWFTAESGGTQITKDSIVSPECTTIYSRWTANTCTVTLDRQSGSGGSSSVKATYGSDMPSITRPTRTGYTFGGYFTGNGGNGVRYYDADGTSARTWDIDSDTYTLYAYWTAKTYMVTLNQQSGSGGTESVTATYGSAMPPVTRPTRAGYTFGGYFTSANGGGTQYYTASGTSARAWSETGITTLYAKWTADTYMVALDVQGGSGGDSSVTATYDATMPKITPPTRTGYDFGGYYSKSNGGGTRYYNADGTSANAWDVASSATIYAKWTPKKYDVTFNTQGGSGGTYSKEVTYDAPMPTITPPSRSGYEFSSYNSAPNGTGTKYYNADGSSATIWNIDSDATLYAQWTAHQYEVAFHPNGADGGETMSNQAFTYNESQYLSAVEFTYTGHAFEKWSSDTNYNYKTEYYLDGELVSNLTAAAGGVATIYANWTGVVYTVTFNANTDDVTLTGEMDPMYCTYDVPTNLTACTFVRDGWGFEGWITNGADGVLFADRARVTNLTATAGEEIALLACWTGATYAVTLDARDPRGDGVLTNADGEVMSVLVNNYAVGGAWNLPSITNVNAHLEFDGWACVDSQGVTNDVPAIVPPQSAGIVTLVAKWSWVPDALATAVDAPDLEFSTFGTVGPQGRWDEESYDADWFVQTTFVHDGSSAVQSGALPVLGEQETGYASWLSTTVKGKGVLSFWWKCAAASRVTVEASDQYGNDTFEVYGEALHFGRYDVNGGFIDLSAELEGYVDWVKVVYTNESETAVTFAWKMQYRPGEGARGGGTGWVDRVTWTPASNGGTLAAASRRLAASAKGVRDSDKKESAKEGATPTHGVPYSWLREKFGLDASASDEKLEELAESLSPGASGGMKSSGYRLSSGSGELSSGKKWPDGTPVMVWQDYWAGTDPHDPNDMFRTIITNTGSGPSISWWPDMSTSTPRRVYQIMCAPTPTTKPEDWTVWPGPGDTGAATNRFFKVRIDLPY